MTRGTRCAALLAALCVATSLARAHDSWLSPARRATSQPVVLELGTGTRFPVQQFSQSAASVAQAGCSDGAGAMSMRPLREEPQWLDLALAGRPDAQPLACWLELRAADIELTPQIAQVYLKEIRAPLDNRQAWADLQARGLPWRESYRKFARIELARTQDAAPAQLLQARRPAGLDLELVILGEQPIAVGQPLEFQLLRDGRPLPGQAVELISERNPLGIWRETDSQGKLRHTLPFGGRWLLRATELRLSGEHPDTWESRFVTLAIEAR